MSPANKAALAVFLSEYASRHAPQHCQISSYPERRLYLAGGFKDGLLTRCVTSTGTQDVPRLFSSHEEADTRLLLHAWDANNSFASPGRIIIKTPDTDVVVLAVCYYPKLKNTNELWVETGRVTGCTDLWRYIPIHTICDSLGTAFCKIIPAVHALTGCDSVSALHGIGKKTVMKVLLERAAEAFKDLSTLGENINESCAPEHPATKAARKLVARLYDQKGKEADCHGCLNKLRVRLAAVKSTPLLNLPPCEATFTQHVLRASWQTKMWLSSHTAQPALPSPDGHGWEREDDTLSPVFFSGPMAEEVLKTLVCVCTGRDACIAVCSCRSNGLQCTEVGSGSCVGL